ncbi:MAG TPA: flagellar motor switch protein FliN [Terriglobales bacterium]|nr:flagellar motor switch protein FliN [Terriglobales bacterium]
MSDVTQENSANHSDSANAFIAIWAQSIAQVLTQIAGSSLTFECLRDAAEAPAPGDGDACFLVVSAGSVRGEMILRLPRTVTLVLAQLFLGEPQDSAAELKAEHKEAVEELLRQIAGHAATALKPRWGEVQLHVESSAPPSWSAAANGWLRSGHDAPAPIWIEWLLSAALHTALASVPLPAAEEPNSEAPQVDPMPTGLVAGNLDLLMDVELEVMLRFGERSMRLQEILELGAGSVVELDRRIEEPADLLLDGRIIARGEVVVVDGNYGLRVLDVGTPQSAN